MTQLIFVRHGQSIGNRDGLFLGHTDLDISELGYKQADMVALYLRNECIDAIYSSDLIRAVHTIEPLAKIKNLDIIKSRLLRERFAGKWEGMSRDELMIKYAREFNIWRTDYGNSYFEEGETTEEHYNRIIAAVKEIAAANCGKTVVIATHATPVRMMMCLAQGVNYKDAQKIPWVSNASVTRMDYEEGIFVLKEGGYTGHLDALATIN